jgi:hypothetical protein
MSKLTEMEKKFCGKGYRGILHQLITRHRLLKGRKQMKKAMNQPW